MPLMKTVSRKYIISLAIILTMLSLLALIFFKIKNILVIIDGNQYKILTFKDTVGETLENKKIVVALKDKLNPPADSKLTKKDTIIIKRAVTINVEADDKLLEIQSAEETIDAMLKVEGITLRTEDKIQPEKETNLSEGLKIAIIRVDTKVFIDSTPLDFKTTITYDSNLSNTQRKTLQEGSTGEKKITTSVVYENNKEVSRQVLDQTIARDPVETIIVQGTYPVMPISRGGDPVAYSKVLKARATAYYAVRGVGLTYTASGRKAIRDSNGYSTIAVDPSMIPYGTRLFIENYGFAIAADTGTDIIGNTIDVFFDTYREACDWAVKYVNVYILK